ncbi:MAG TPA: DUF4344 domain-containing metallopeptidase [Candidatus Wallbacteria bacterium]|nr:MAG: hypothetical protein BWY32_02215 [bacterium ADurb.Bin243]HOD40887.1 DUF4344 domain-containing metallopeptidase [Candidatus Wallbacteria bacterium]HPG58045.1 DUF4344 domain-containing metallopeptidase [Candidatus Wallbacteria bacterium]
MKKRRAGIITPFITAFIIILFFRPALFAGAFDYIQKAGGALNAEAAPGSQTSENAPLANAAQGGKPACPGGHVHGPQCGGHKIENSNLVIIYGKAGGEEYEVIKNEIKESQIFETLAQHLGLQIKLPAELKLKLCMAGEENAYYDSEKKEILISYELLRYFEKLVESQQGLSEDEKAELFVDLAFFVTLHELGHALIDIFDLPITGKEEDVADQLAAWIILKTFGDDDHQAVLALINASEWFVAEFDAGQIKAEDLEFAGSHSLDPQRFYNMITWAYGFNPNAATAALGSDIEELLPEERIEFAEAEFERMDKSFMTLLEKYLK